MSGFFKAKFLAAPKNDVKIRVLRPKHVLDKSLKCSSSSCASETSLKLTASLLPRSPSKYTKNYLSRQGTTSSDKPEPDNNSAAEKYFESLSMLDSIISSQPSLSKTLLKVKEFIEEYVASVLTETKDIKGKLNVSNEDFQKISKRFKNLAFENLELQEKGRKKRKRLSELKETLKEKENIIHIQSVEISDFKEKIEAFRSKNFFPDKPTKNDKKIKSNLKIEIPRKPDQNSINFEESPSFLNSESGACLQSELKLEIPISPILIRNNFVS